MNKKFVSFVLAMFLSVGLGVVSVFADSYSNYANKFHSYAGGSDRQTIKVKVGSASDELKGNLTGVFSYFAGSAISCFAAGGNYSIYDSFGSRFSASNAGGMWTLTGVSLRYSDYANMPKLGDFVKKNDDGSYATVTEETTNYYKVGYKEVVYVKSIKDANGNKISVADYNKLSAEEQKKCTLVGKISVAAYNKLTAKQKEEYSLAYTGKEITRGDYDNLTEEQKENYQYFQTKITKDEYDKLKKSGEESSVTETHYVKYTKECYQQTIYTSIQAKLWKAYKTVDNYTAYKDADGNYITEEEYKKQKKEGKNVTTETISASDADKLNDETKEKLKVKDYKYITAKEYDTFNASEKSKYTVVYSTSKPADNDHGKFFTEATENFTEDELKELIRDGQVTSNGKTALKLDDNGNIKTSDFKNNSYKEVKKTQAQFDALDDEEKLKYSKETKELSAKQYSQLTDAEKKFIIKDENGKDKKITKEITKKEYDSMSAADRKEFNAKRTEISESEWKNLSASERLSYSKEEKHNKSWVTSETKTVTHYAFTSDAAKNNYVAAMKAFLMSMGFTESQLTVAKMDEDGNLLDKNGNKIKYSDDDNFDGELGTQEISADWFVELGQQLAKGVNGSASISIGSGVTGPSLTLMEDGKAQIVYQTDATTGEAIPTTMYCYNDDGFLYQIVSRTFEINKSKDGYAEGEWTQTVTDISYSDTGIRTDKTYEIHSWPNTEQERRDAIANAVMPEDEDAEVSAEHPCYLVSTVVYTANGSQDYSYDFKTNNKTFFANGKPSYTINAQGTEIAVYEYSANGVCQAYFNAEGTDASGEKVGTTTIYDKWGRALFTARTGSANEVIGNPKAREALMVEYYSAIKNGGFKRDTTIVGYYMYADTLLNMEECEKAGLVSENGFVDVAALTAMSYDDRFFNPLSKMGFTKGDILNMLRFNNGSSAVSYTTIDTAANFTDKDTNLATADDVVSTRVTTSKSGGTHDYGNTLDKKKSKKGITYNNTIFIGGAQAYSKEYKVVTEIKETIVKESDPVVEGNLFPDVSDEELEANGIDPKDEKAVAEYKQKKLEKMAVDLEIGEYDEDGNFIIKDGEESAYEELKKGFYTDKKTGKTYALVNASTINIMDGSGFQSAIGETVFVEIDEATKTSIIKNGSTKIMFMGDVRPSVATGSNGKAYLTMAMNTSYGGGVVQGKEAVQNAKNEIFLASMGAALNNGADIQTIQQQIDDYNAANGTNYSPIDATTAYTEANKSDSQNNWVVQNTNVNMKIFNNQNYDYRAGWALLLGNNSINVNLEEDFIPALF